MVVEEPVVVVPVEVVREAAELPIQTDRTQAGGPDKVVARNVVDLECAGVDVVQHHVALAGTAGRTGPATCPARSDLCGRKY